MYQIIKELAKEWKKYTEILNPATVREGYVLIEPTTEGFFIYLMEKYEPNQ